MKKTFIALLALAGFAYAAGPTTITFDAQQVTQKNRGTALGGVAFQLADTDRMNISFTDPSVTEMPASLTTVSLNSISLQVHSVYTDGWNADLTMYVVDAEKHLIAVSEALGAESITSSSTQTFTFNDTASLISNGKTAVNQSLTLGTQYYAYFIDKAEYAKTSACIGTIGIGDVATWIDAKAVALELYQYDTSASASLDNTVMKSGSTQVHQVEFNGQYGAIMSIATTPEPATATLSLMALAGLMARRKRH